MRILLYIATSVLLLFGSPAFAQDTKTEYAPASPNADPNRPGYELVLDARLVAKGKTIERGLVWRVFGDKANDDGKLPLIATAKGGTASFTLPGGTYLVHAAFGRAGASKRVVVSGPNISESFVLEAGGLQLDATSNEQIIPPKDLRFSIYELEEDEEGNRKLIALNVAAQKVIQLNQGTYHVISSYGKINATVRADLQVKAGEITKAFLQHRGASVSLRLVSKQGGDPIANTSWSVLTEDGEQVFESTSIAPSLILAEGTYEAVAKNGDDNFRKTFAVRPGKNSRVEVSIN